MTVVRKWFAVKGVPLRKFLYELRLVPHEAGWGLDGKFPSEASGTRLESGWYLIIVKKEWDDSPDEAMLAKLSTPGEIVRCLVDEAKASTEAQGFRAGAKQWELRHDPAEGPAALQVSGTPPECFAAIRQRRLTAQPSDGPLGGGFGIPIDVCESLTGFRYNDLSTVTEPYSYLDVGWDSGWSPED